ncbi:MAG: glutamine amidotransferase subunit PdxT [Thermoplasmatales archaeon B_DKE]|nr:MAG: glutamine amidotransferase subunit PdxT [Thermoplasmatales archaeon B_DKE]
MQIGVLGFQGDVQEHVTALKQVLEPTGGSVILVRKAEDLESISGLVIPGGESTTIYKLISMYRMYDRIRELGRNGLPIMGTCAGLIILSRETNDERVQGMGLLDIEIMRNGYGRQINSFIDRIEIDGVGKFPAVFIRAPVIAKTGNVDVMAYDKGSPVMVRKDNILGLTFHPELTGDLRIHEYFVRMGGRGTVPVEEKRVME